MEEMICNKITDKNVEKYAGENFACKAFVVKNGKEK